MTQRHPMQPLIKDEEGTVRFKSNKIVEYLLELGRAVGKDLNALHCMNFSQADWVQFNQLIGYSVSGFHELSIVPDEVALEASRRAKAEFAIEVGCRCGEGCSIHSGVEWE